MKRIIYILLCITLVISCQKADDNGDLGGWWKLMQIEEIENDTVIDKSNEDCFWAIQLRMITANTESGVIAKGRFQHVEDSLFIQMIQRPSDCRGVGMYNPENERFGVNKLTNKRMILQSNEVRLTFRKF
jgi:hypothetical protein